LATQFPHVAPEILTGTSAGAVNAAYPAAHTGSFRHKADDLAGLWGSLRMDQVFRVDPSCLALNIARWGLRLLSGGSRSAPVARSLVDTQPLRTLLGGVLGAEDGTVTGIDRNLRAGALTAIALTASRYSTGQSITWVQGRDIPSWERAHRKSINTRIRVEHVMASSALPLFFPAIQVDGRWYGDGGVRLSAPLSPAVHLGGERILAISSRYADSRERTGRSASEGYPATAQVVGVLFDAIFLDLLDADALRLERINQLVDALPEDQRGRLRHIDLLVLRPSRDLGQLASKYEAALPRAFRFMMRGLGTRDTRSNALLSLVLFQPDYLRRLMQLGESDTRARADEIAAFLRPAGSGPIAQAAMIA
jgi:NTE family protein